jgi:hypothetical protein
MFRKFRSLECEQAITDDKNYALMLSTMARRCICSLNYEAFNLAVVGRFDLVKRLVSFRSRNWKGVDYTPLMRAINENAGFELIQKLVEIGEPIDTGRSDDNYTALDYAFQKSHENDESMITYLYLLRACNKTSKEYEMSLVPEPTEEELSSYWAGIESTAA